jgi:signal transduction histidine kinase
VCLVLVVWLGYHEFVEEPAEYAAKGMPNLHKDVDAEIATISFLAVVPILLGVGWWWFRRVLKPLQTLAVAVDKVHSHNLHEMIPRSLNGDEVDQLAAVFNSMTSRLDSSIRQIHEFTLHASHELKTPLTVMRAQLETVLRESPSALAEQNKWILGQMDEVKRMTQIVDQLTLLTKADAGLIQLEHKAVPFWELVEASFEDAQNLSRAHGIAVSMIPLPQLNVLGDRQRLRQLLLILVDNAVKYNRPDGTIEFSLKAVGGSAEFRLVNTGTEVVTDSLGRLFERFARGANAQGRVEGCGLGLTIARWIVHAHGGSILLSCEPGGLFTIVVHLPLA